MITARYILAAFVALLPLILSAQPMRSERLDFPPIAIGTSDEREVRVDNLPDDITFLVIDTCDAPFRVTTPLNELVSKNGELRVRVEFLPTQAGSFRDEIILEHRPPSFPPGERIRIRLNGTGFRLERVDRIEFGTTLIGDSVQKMILIRDNFLRDVRWSVTRPPSGPFATLDPSAPYRPNRDTVGFRFTYAPAVVGRSVDTVGLIRTYIPTGEALDTIQVILDGTGVTMKDSAEILFRDLTQGMTVSQDLTLQLPTSPMTREFRYSLAPRILSGSIAGSIKHPTGASRTSSITTSFTARPRTPRDVREQYVLVRSRTDGRRLDSTIITAIVTLLPQPVELRAAYSADTLRHRIGDTVRFEIVATSREPLADEILLRDVVAECAINGTVLVPIIDDQTSMFTRDDRAYVRVAPRDPVTVNTSGDVIVRWTGIVVLGDAAFSPLTLESVSATLQDGTRIILEPSSSIVLVTNVWTMPDGAQRLVNPRGTQLEVSIAPNPITSNGIITIANVPTGAGRLEIADTRGIVVSDLTQEVRSGRTEFSVASNGAVDVQLQPGIYYARLSAQLSPTAALSSVVRAFVIR